MHQGRPGMNFESEQQQSESVDGFLRSENVWGAARIRFGKAGAHPQLAWESQLPLKPYLSLQPLDF